jgi:DNA-binding NtrC family response regulator
MSSRRPCILLAETEAPNLEILQHALKERADLLVADSQERALELIVNTDVDLCLCGLGLDLLKQLNERQPNVGRILMSAYAEASVLLSAINEGAIYKFIPKPFGEEQIVSAVDEFFRSTRVPGQGDLILVVDDSSTIRELVANVLTGAGLRMVGAKNGREALEIVKEQADALAVALVDLEMPEIGGLELVGELQKLAPKVPAIILSGHVNHQLALDCIAWGAFDFVSKPMTREELLFRVKRATNERRRRTELSAYQAAAGSATTQLVASSPAMQRVLAQASAMARTDSTVLITGETGAGKDALAREIHRLSRRSGRMFLAVNCGALPETLLESELFGHEKGAFTGAVAKREGFFEIADGGTIFLDEIGETTPATQVKLLQVLESMTFVRVGGTKPIHVDARVIAATNRGLEQMVKDGRFRADLYYRLFVMPLKLPALRDRKEDIDGLIRLALRRVAPQRRLSLSSDALARAMAYGWPGNVRELFHRIERAVVLTTGDRIDDLELPTTGVSLQVPAAAPSVDIARPLKEVVSDAVSEAERRYLRALLEKTQGNLAETAKRAGVDRKSIYNKMKAYDLDKEAFKA